MNLVADRHLQRAADDDAAFLSGVGQDMPDPVARAIGQLLDHLHAVDGRLEGMCKALTALGSDYCAKDLPTLRDEDFADVCKDQQQGDKPAA